MSSIIHCNSIRNTIIFPSNHPSTKENTRQHTRPGQHNRTQRKHNEMTKHTYSTQLNKHKTKQTYLLNKTLHNTREIQFNTLQYNRRQDETQHDTIRYDTIRCDAKPYSILNALLNIKCFLEISKQFLFPRNKSVSKRNISSSRIRDQKAMKLLLDF